MHERYALAVRRKPTVRNVVISSGHRRMRFLLGELAYGAEHLRLATCQVEEYQTLVGWRLIGVRTREPGIAIGEVITTHTLEAIACCTTSVRADRGHRHIVIGHDASLSVQA